MSLKKRIFYIIVVLAVLFVSIFPMFYVSAEINHACIGDNCCSVCRQINICEQIKKIYSNIPQVSLSILISLALFILSIVVYDKAIKHITPVTLKVKLLN